MTIRKLRVSLILALAPLAACGNGGQDQAAIQGGLSAVDGESAPARAATPDSAADYLVRLVPLEGGEGAGTVAFRPLDGRTEITARLAGAAGARDGHIHRGETCDEIGEAWVPLPPVTTDAGGEGQGVVTVDFPLDSLMNGGTLAVYDDGGDPGSPAFCGDIPVLTQDLAGDTAS